MNVNLKLLQTFILVAEHLSFRQAAELTFRSQSAISAQIRQLEEQLGLVLLHRTTRSVELTMEGKQLLEGARRAMGEVQHSLRVIAESVELSNGRVQLGCAPTLAAGYVPGILARFERDYPNVRVHIREATSGELIHALKDGQIDLAFAQTVPPDADLRIEVLRDDPLVALVPRHLSSKRRKNIRLAELAGMPLLQLAPTTAMSRMIEDSMREAGLSFVSKYNCNNALTLIALAEAGLGVAILPRSVLKVAHMPNAQALQIQSPGLYRQLALIWRRDRELSPAAERLAQLIRREMASTRHL